MISRCFSLMSKHQSLLRFWNFINKSKFLVFPAIRTIFSLPAALSILSIGSGHDNLEGKIFTLKFVVILEPDIRVNRRSVTNCFVKRQVRRLHNGFLSTILLLAFLNKFSENWCSSKMR